MHSPPLRRADPDHRAAPSSSPTTTPPDGGLRRPRARSAGRGRALRRQGAEVSGHEPCRCHSSCPIQTAGTRQTHRGEGLGRRAGRGARARGAEPRGPHRRIFDAPDQRGGRRESARSSSRIGLDPCPRRPPRVVHAGSDEPFRILILDGRAQPAGVAGRLEGAAILGTPIDRSTLRGRIVLSTEDDVYTANVDGTGLVQVTSRRGAEFDPFWSPDGSRIVYRDSRRGINHDDEICVMNADGSERSEHHERSRQRLGTGLVAGRRHDRVQLDPPRLDDERVPREPGRIETAQDPHGHVGRVPRLVARRHAHRVHGRPRRGRPSTTSGS